MIGGAMREPKYRAWLKKEQKMYPVKGLIWFDGDIGAGLDTIRVDVKVSNITTDCLFKGPDDVELMQFTGLQDASGCDIFEGDIVRFDDEVYPVTWGQFSDCCVEGETWLLGEGDFWQPTVYAHLDKLEIIGNIYEHHHLLDQPAK
jgi:hypothetical protein